MTITAEHRRLAALLDDYVTQIEGMVALIGEPAVYSQGHHPIISGFFDVILAFQYHRESLSPTELDDLFREFSKLSRFENVLHKFCIAS